MNLEDWLQKEYARELAFQALDNRWDELFYPEVVRKILVDFIRPGSEVEDVIREIKNLSYNFSYLLMKVLAEDLLKVANEVERLYSKGWDLKTELNNAIDEVKPILENILGITLKAKPSLELRPYDERSGNLGSHPPGTNKIIIYVTNINNVASLHIRKGVLAHELCHTIMNEVEAADWFREGLAISLAIYAWEKLNKKNLANDFFYFVYYGSKRLGLTKRLMRYRRFWINVQNIIGIIGLENIKFLIRQNSEVQDLLLECTTSGLELVSRLIFREWLVNLIQKPTEEVKKSLERFLSSSHEERLKLLGEFE
ncbi:MAG: hypothetical protein QXR44_06590 [Thermoproteota archaeon]